MKTNNNLHQRTVDMMTWGLLRELNFKNILNKVNVDQIHNVIYRFLKKKIEDKELTVVDIEEIANNIRAKAKVLFNKIGEDWGRGVEEMMVVMILLQLQLHSENKIMRNV